MILVISFLYCWCRRHWNNFRCCATLQFKRRFNNLVQIYFPPTHFFHEKLLKKETVLCDKPFSFGSVIEGIPNSFLRVSYEDAFLRFGFELVQHQLLDVSFASPNFKKRQLRFSTKPQFIRCRLNGFRWCPI